MKVTEEELREMLMRQTQEAVHTAQANEAAARLELAQARLENAGGLAIASSQARGSYITGLLEKYKAPKDWEIQPDGEIVAPKAPPAAAAPPRTPNRQERRHAASGKKR